MPPASRRRTRDRPSRRDAGSPRARRREHARVAHGVEAWRRHAGGQAAQQRQRVHVHRDRPVGVRLLQGDAHQAVGALLEALLGDRRAQHVAPQRLAPPRVKRPRTSRRVQGEPVERGAQRLVVGEWVRLERLTAAYPLRPGGWRLARDGGGGEVDRAAVACGAAARSSSGLARGSALRLLSGSPATSGSAPSSLVCRCRALASTARRPARARRHRERPGAGAG